MRLVSPLINDALAAADVSGAQFLSEFAARHRVAAEWTSAASGLTPLRTFRIRARLVGRAVLADARLADGCHLDETGATGILRLPVDLPATIDAGAIGRPIGSIVGHPLTARATAVIVRIVPTPDASERVIVYEAPLEPLRP